jgi:hypothetical protein
VNFLEWDEGKPVDLDLRVALGVYHDSPDEPRRVRLLDADGEERARLVGVLTWEEGEGWVRFVADEGDGLVASLTIPVDDAIRCASWADGTISGTLPNGAEWITTPLCELEGGGETR